MRKIISAVLLCIMLFTFTACEKGKIADVKVNKVKSEIYSQKDIDEAINTTLKYFKKNFKGCTLTEIDYIGDDKIDEFKEWQKTYDKDEVIILISSFNVDSSGGDGSLNPNSTYTRWQWILARDENQNWKHMDHGY